MLVVKQLYMAVKKVVLLYKDIQFSNLGPNTHALIKFLWSVACTMQIPGH